MRIALFCWLALSLSTEALGADVRGRVTDPIGTPIPGAVVTAKPTNQQLPLYSTATDRNGAFRLKDIAAGEYAISVASPGFVVGRQTVTVGSRDLTRDFSLKIGPTGSPEVRNPEVPLWSRPVGPLPCNTPGVICDDFGMAEYAREYERNERAVSVALYSLSDISRFKFPIVANVAAPGRRKQH